MTFKGDSMARLACSTAILALALGGTSIYFSWVATMDLRRAKQELRQVRQEGQDLWKAVESLSSGTTELRRRQLARAPASGENPDLFAKATPLGAVDGDSQLLGLEARVAEIERTPLAFPRKEDLFQRFSELKGEAYRVKIHWKDSLPSSASEESAGRRPSHTSSKLSMTRA